MIPSSLLPLVERLGWTLLHSLWQGALAWIAWQVASTLLRHRSARIRYLAACAALAFATLAPWITFFTIDLHQRLEMARPLPPSPLPASTTPTPGPLISLPLLDQHPDPQTSLSAFTAPQSAFDQKSLFPRSVLPWLVATWMSGFIWHLLRLAHGWRQTLRLASVPLAPPANELLRRLTALAQQLRLRRDIRIGETLHVAVPTVIGWLHPVILLPASALSGLTPAQIDALLAHELAHIHRADFWVNLLQAIAEALFFYHPAIHALNRAIRTEREHACDDIAVILTRDPLACAQALAKLETLRAPAPITSSPHAALALSAAGNDSESGQLLTRIRRILGLTPIPSTTTYRKTIASLGGATVLGVACYLTAMLASPAIAACILTHQERIDLINASLPATERIGIVIWDAVQRDTDKIFPRGKIDLIKPPSPNSEYTREIPTFDEPFDAPPLDTARLFPSSTPRSNAKIADRDLTTISPDRVITTSGKVLPFRDRDAHLKQQIEVRFNRSPDMPSPRGGIEILAKFETTPPQDSWHFSQLPIIDEIVRFYVKAPAEIRLSPYRLRGYTFQPRIIIVTDSTVPLQVTLDLIPAGMIKGRIFDSDGTPMPNAKVALHPKQKPALTDRPSLKMEAETDANGNYTITPVPFDTEWVLLVDSRKDWRYHITNVLPILTGENPIQAIDVTLSSGKEYSGRLLDQDGRPMPRAKIKFSWQFPFSYIYGKKDVSTDDGGHFKLPRINLEVPGGQSIRFGNSDSWLPPFSMPITRDTPAEITLTCGPTKDARPQP